jgi:ABC-type transport system involved in cytochrome bd biosynthesis fused ATPase/permease subunit
VLYVDSLTDADGVAPTYLRLLTYNAETIVSGFSGEPNESIAVDSPLDLTLDDVTVAYSNGHVALHDAGFELRPGNDLRPGGHQRQRQINALQGHHGVSASRARNDPIAGRPVHEAHKRQWVAYVPQSEDVDWAFPVTVWDVVLMGRYGAMNFLRIPRAEDKRIALESLERVKMAEFRDRQIGELSGGQKKRVFLAGRWPSAGASSCSTNLSAASMSAPKPPSSSCCARCATPATSCWSRPTTWDRCPSSAMRW